MRNLLAFTVALFLLGACKESGDLDLSIIPVYDGEALTLNESFSFGDMSVKFEKLSFYISDVVLITDGGKEQKLADVEFVLLNDGVQGQTITYDELEGASYVKMRFNVGLTEDLNAKTPSDYAVDDDLGRSDHYWEAWSSYIFSKTEGSADPDGDGEFDLKWFYHTGSDALMREVEVEVDVVIQEDAVSKLGLSLDYARLLENEDGTPFDIESKPRNHNPEDTEIITKLVDNYERAFKMDK